MAKLYIFGDSVLGGVTLDEGTLRYQKSAFSPEVFLSGESWEVENLSKFGCTAPKASALLNKCLTRGEQMDFALLELGGNDCDYRWSEISDAPESEHLPNTPKNAFYEELCGMVETLRKASVKPILTRLAPIDAEKYFAWVSRGQNAENILHFLGDVQHIYRHQEAYSDVCVRVAMETGCPLLDLREPFLSNADFKNLLCLDGIHPNEKGHALLRGCMTEFFRAF